MSSQPGALAPMCASMTEDDGEYLYRRAEAELEMAQKAEATPAVKAHYEMAEAYLERAAEIAEEAAPEAG